MIEFIFRNRLGHTSILEEVLTVLQPFSYSRKSAGGPISLESNNCDLRGELTQVISENLSVVLASHKPNSDPNREPPLGNLHYLCPHSVDFRFGTGSNDYVYHVLKNRLAIFILFSVALSHKSIVPDWSWVGMAASSRMIRSMPIRLAPNRARLRIQ